jgi:hypothetical protein
LNLVPSIALSIFGMVAELPVAPVAETTTSRCLAWSMVLTGLVCQVTQICCCLPMLPIHSSSRASYLTAGLPNSGSSSSVL